MSRTTIVLENENNAQPVVLGMPDDLPVAQLITDLIEAIRLPLNNQHNQQLVYMLRRKKTGQLLSYKNSLASSGVLRGETLVLVPVQARPEGGYKVRATTNLAASVKIGVVGSVYTSKESKVLAIADSLAREGAWQEGLLQLLKFWHENFMAGEPAISPVILTMLDSLYTNFVAVELEVGNSQQVLDIYNLPASLILFENSDMLRTRQVAYLLGTSRSFAKQGRYELAREAAILALQLDSINAEARSLEKLGRLYHKWQTSADPQVRLELAQNIARLDPHYGAIERDLRESLMRAQNL